MTLFNIFPIAAEATESVAKAVEKAQYEFKFQPDTIGTSLGVMLEGMLGIFVAIGVIMAVIAIAGRIGKNKKK